MAVRVGWGIQGRAASIAGAIDSATPLYQFLWLLSCLVQESNTTDKNIPGFSGDGRYMRLFERVGFFPVGSSQKIICADMVVIRQNMQGGNGNIQPAQFIIGICGLMDIQHVSNIFLL